jgi:hypothetical protein
MKKRKKRTKKIVRIEIRGGIADILSVPAGVRVEMRDYDTEGVDGNPPFVEYECDGPVNEDATFAKD